MRRTYQILSIALLGATLGAIATAQPPTATTSAYPPSPIIKSLVITSDRHCLGNGDNWAISWADDGDLYTVYCDGSGFGGGSGQGSMGMAKVTGTPPALSGQNIDSVSGHAQGNDVQGRKTSGLLVSEGVLYMWVRNLKTDGTGASLAWSHDHARTWSWADWSFPEIGYPVWMNAGRNYEAAADGFAYTYFADTPSAYKSADQILLARVPKQQITRKESYEFFAGLDAGQPRWSSRFEDRKPVFVNPGRCHRPEVVYNPGLKRYLLCTATYGTIKWCGSNEKYLGIFDAPTPWGPWSVVKEIPGWGDPDENRFQPRIPAKWISDDGTRFWLLYSCFPKGPYKFIVQHCTLELNKAR